MTTNVLHAGVHQVVTDDRTVADITAEIIGLVEESAQKMSVGGGIIEHVSD